MRKKPRRRGRGEAITVFLLAFGLGLLIALFCSARLALCLAAIALVYVGITMNC